MVLFEENCSMCHGEDGRGGIEEGATGLPINLQSFLTIAPKDYIIKTILHGRPTRGMPDFAEDLTKEEVSSLATFIKSWQYQPSKKIAKGVVRGDPKKGKEWYRGICANCHGIRGEGAPYQESGGTVLVSFNSFSAPALADPGFLKSASDGFIKAALIYGRMGTPMTSFLKGNQGTVELTETDINDIVAYIRSMPVLKTE